MFVPEEDNNWHRHQHIFVYKSLLACMSAQNHRTGSRLLCSHLSCASAVRMKAITACVETMQFQYLSVCLCYKFAADMGLVRKKYPHSQSLEQHFEH